MFDIFSWDTWFESLTQYQYQSLRLAWLRAIKRLGPGYERDALEWGIEQMRTWPDRRKQKA